MATSFDAQAVKSLDKSSSHKRFTFKTFRQRVAEIDIKVYRNLDPIKSEPSQGSTFFRDSLAEWRELNTAGDFISFYEEIFPLVQTLPQIILQKELIISKILDRLQIKCRLSLDPIFSLIAALSRDILDDLLPFLPRIVDSLVSLLINGGDREPEVMKQAFTSWSSIMMYLQRYLIKDLVHVLKVTRELRFYPNDFVRTFVAESLSFLFRNASQKQLKKGTRWVLREVVMMPSAPRTSAVSELFSFTLMGTSSSLHSGAKDLLCLLLGKSSFDIGGQEVGDSIAVVEVLISIFNRLSMVLELEPNGLNIIFECLLSEIRYTICRDSPDHLSQLISLLICAYKNVDKKKVHMKEVYEYDPLLLAKSLVDKFFGPSVEDMNHPTQLIDNVLKLLLFIVHDLFKANKLQALSDESCHWAPVFKIRCTSFLGFLERLLKEDERILMVFKTDIIRAFNNLLLVPELLVPEAEVMNLLLIFLERLHMPTSNICSVLGVASKEFSNICIVLSKIFNSEDQNSMLEGEKPAILWAAIKCCPYIFGKDTHSVLSGLLYALDNHLQEESGNPDKIIIRQTLIGAILDSRKKTLPYCENGADEAGLGEFVYFAMKYPSSSHILSAVADMLDSVFGNPTQEQINPAWNTFDALKLLSENLSNSDKQLRLSSLRILSHYEHSVLLSSVEQVGEYEHGGNVLKLLLLFESAPVSIENSQKMTLSRLQMIASTGRLAKQYAPALLYGIIGIFHTRFRDIWNDAVKCLAKVISQYFGSIWDTFVHHLEKSILLLPSDQSSRTGDESLYNVDDLGRRFSSHVWPFNDSTSSVSVFSLLLQSLQEVASLVESRIHQLVPLFLKFLGYNVEGLLSVEVYMLKNYTHKEWNEALKEWLNLFRLMRNPKSFSSDLGQFLKEVFLFRLLEDNDTEVQTRVLDCLLNWNGDFLVSYNSHLRNLILTKNLREELTTWSISKESNLIDEVHRAHVVPIVIRILVSKVRKLKTLASRKHSSVHIRKAILGFLAQLEVDELFLLFDLLIKPLHTPVQGAIESSKCIPVSPDSLKDKCNGLLEQFTVAVTEDLSWKKKYSYLSWKKKYSFLHVIEEVFDVFDQWRIDPFLGLLMGCVVCILENCTMTLERSNSDETLERSNSDETLERSNSDGSSSDDSDETLERSNSDETLERSNSDGSSSDDSDGSSSDDSDESKKVKINIRQLKELRSLCIKIISSGLNKYENYSFGDDFWEHFFSAVRPLILGFKQEGASSERPNNLFSCFLAMSRSLKFVPLLSREKNLVPDIFLILTVPTTSDAVISSVLNFVENLLTLDFELGGEDSSVNMILLLHLDVLISSLHSLFTADNSRLRKLTRYPGDKELAIFKMLSKYVTQPLAATKFMEILLPILEKKTKNSDSCVSILHIIQHIVPYIGSEITEKVLTSLSPLLTFAGLEVRLAICDVLNSLAQSDNSVHIVGKMLSELNASSSMDIDGLDYDTIIGAYEKINKDYFYTLNKEQAAFLLSQSIHDMSSEEMILRQSAYGMLLKFIDFSCAILNSKERPYKKLWSEACVQQLISKLLLKHMGKAMHKDTAIQKIWIDLLREMVFKLPKVANLESYGTLCSPDAEQDFFNNIVHLQKHRRARALLKFVHGFSLSHLSEIITKTVFVPLFFNILFNLQEGKGENVRHACLEALGSISGRMSWKEYRALLMRCFREMNIKRDKQRVLLRLLCSILDNFHFSAPEIPQELILSAENNQATETSVVIPSPQMDSSGLSAELSDIQTFLQGTLLPKIQKLLSFDSDKVNVNVCLVALKLLKLLPRETMKLRLPSIIQRISNLLKNRLDSVREEARAAMAVCLKELGVEYLQVIVQSLRSTLKRGYELHVLGYSVHFLLTKFLVTPSVGKLDYCLDDLLYVAENDILGDISEQKDVEKIASKMKEARKQKSYDSLKLISQSVTFKTHVLKLLSPVMAHLQKQLTPKLKLKLESMLSHIAAGIENNPSVKKTDLFIFVYRLIKDGITDENSADKIPLILKPKKGDGELDRHISDPDRLIHIDPRYSHLLTVFALRLLHNYTKKMLVRNKDEDLLSLLDRFVSLLCDCLSSKYEHTVSTALKCLSPLVGLPLPSLESLANKIKNSLLAIAQGPRKAGSPLMDSCLRLLTLILRNTSITLAADQLHMVIRFPLFIDLERNPSFVALSLLKAIVNRKLVVPEVYDVVKKVAELIVTSQVESVRKKCSKILLQFLMDYPLENQEHQSLIPKRLQEHLDFLLSNLRYEHASGREAVLEMLHAIIKKFPPRRIKQLSQTIFLHLVVCLSNDQDSKVRSMTGSAIKLLIHFGRRYSTSSSQPILESSLSWYMGEHYPHLWSAAAQVLGLFVEEMKNDFEEYRAKALLPQIQRILQSSVGLTSNNLNDVSSEGSDCQWKAAYYSLILMEKILLQFDNLYLDKKLEKIWETVCDLLLHPHMWLRSISNRLLALYFVHVPEAPRMETCILMDSGRLFLVAASLFCQLRNHVDDTASTLIAQNLVFAIRRLHLLLDQKGSSVGHKSFSLNVCPIVRHKSFSLNVSKDLLTRAVRVVDPRNVSGVVACLTSDQSSQHGQETEARQHLVVSYLLKKMGKLALEAEFVQMRIILDCYRLLPKNILVTYAYQVLLPVYKICEGYAGKVISDDMKQVAQEVCESISNNIEREKFVEVYSKIRRELKTKRDKRKQQDKLMAVINPVRNAKRKLRVAAKHRANKRRKILTTTTTMKMMGIWMPP